MSSETIVFVGVVITAFLSFITNRNTASSAAVAALAKTIETLRNELTAVEEARKKDKEEFENHRAKLEAQIKRYQTYINKLVDLLMDHKIDVPAMPEDG